MSYGGQYQFTMMCKRRSRNKVPYVEFEQQADSLPVDIVKIQQTSDEIIEIHEKNKTFDRQYHPSFRNQFAYPSQFEPPPSYEYPEVCDRYSQGGFPIQNPFIFSEQLLERYNFLPFENSEVNPINNFHKHYDATKTDQPKQEDTQLDKFKYFMYTSFKKQQFGSVSKIFIEELEFFIASNRINFEGTFPFSINQRTK